MWGQLHVWVSTAACCWTVLPCQQPRTFTWFFSLRQMLFIMAFKIFRVGRVAVSRNHLLTEVPVSWTGCFNMCLFLRWEGSEERAAFCWALPCSREPNLPSLTATPCRRQCHCLALVRLITPIYSSCWAATGGARDWVFPARPRIVHTNMYPHQRKMFKEVRVIPVL